MKRSRFNEEQIIAILREQGGGGEDSRCMPKARGQRGDVLQMEGQVRRDGRLGRSAAEGTRGRERQTEEAIGRGDARQTPCCGTWPPENGDARRSTRGRLSPPPGLRGEPAAGMPGDQC